MRRRGPIFTRRDLLAAAAALPLAGCATRPGPSGGRLRIATFNIWHDAGDWEKRRPLLIRTLEQLDADVIALQEVLEDAAKNLPNQARTLAQALGGYSVHFSSRDPEGAPRRFGNALLLRLPVLESDSRNLAPLGDYRTALRVRAEAHGRRVDFVNTHLAWEPDAGAVRAEQIADLMSWLPGDGVPLVLAGDFNAPLSDPGLAAITSGRFEAAALSHEVLTTLNPAKGHAPRIIDHVFAERRWFTIPDAGILGDRAIDGEYPSDHFGVAATLAFR